MICPVCKAEYREGFYRCVDCGVDLVNVPPKDFAPKPSAQVPVIESSGDTAALLWRGGDPVVFTTIISALEQAQIPYLDLFGHDYKAQAVSPFPSAFDTGNGFEIRVFQAHLPAASRIVEEVLDQEPEESPIQADADDSTGSAETSEKEIPEDWDPAFATVEVWCGEDEEMAQMLSDCLRENGIGSRIDSDSRPSRLLVQPADAERAGEIVREVVEGTPPA